MNRPVWVLLLAALSAGCVSKHAGMPKGSDVAWRIGQTTRREVVERWGNPDRLQGPMWIWKDWNLLGGKFKASYMMVGLTVANSRVSTREHRLTFDDLGVLESVETVDSLPNGVGWSVNPFH